MREFVITVNSTVDLPKEWLEERHVPVLPLKYTIDGENYTDIISFFLILYISISKIIR